MRCRSRESPFPYFVCIFQPLLRTPPHSAFAQSATLTAVSISLGWKREKDRGERKEEEAKRRLDKGWVRGEMALELSNV